VSGILVIAEQRRGELRPVSLELVGAAQSLRRDGEQVAVAVLGPRAWSLRTYLSVAGVDTIVTVKVPQPEFDPDTFVAAVGALIDARSPDVVLVAHSVDSFGYAAALAPYEATEFATMSSKSSASTATWWQRAAAMVKKVSVELDFPNRSTVLLALAQQHVQAPDPGAAPQVDGLRGARDNRSRSG